MPLNSPMFHPLPSKEKLLERIELYKEHNADLNSYMWFLLPLAAKFGDRVFEVSAKSLAESGLSITLSKFAPSDTRFRPPKDSRSTFATAPCTSAR